MTSEDLIAAKHAGMAMEGWPDARLHYLPHIGYIARDETGKIQAVGCVAWIGRSAKSGKAVGIFSITDEFRRERAAALAYRRCIEVIDLALLITPKIFAEPDRDIEKAEPFMRRLGFAPEGKEWVRHAGTSIRRDGIHGRGGSGLVCDGSLPVADGDGHRAPAGRRA
jgi:CBS domain-containing protein